MAQSAGVYFRIRGIGAGSNAAVDPSVAPYIDGVYIPRPGAILSSFLDVDHVEVLRGPQGTLFGRNATVGAISITTIEPQFSGDSGEVSAEAGDYGEYKFEGIGNLAINDKLAGRIAAFDEHTDGYINDTATGQTLGRSDTFGVRGSLRARITDDLEWTGRVDYARTSGFGINLSQPDVATASAAQIAHFSARSTIPIGYLTGPSFDTIQRFDNPSLADRQYGLTSDLKWDVADGYELRLIDGAHWWRDAQTDGDVVFTPLDLLNRHGSFTSDSQSHELQLISPKRQAARRPFGLCGGDLLLQRKLRHHRGVRRRQPALQLRLRRTEARFHRPMPEIAGDRRDRWRLLPERDQRGRLRSGRLQADRDADADARWPLHARQQVGPVRPDGHQPVCRQGRPARAGDHTALIQRLASELARQSELEDHAGGHDVRELLDRLQVGRLQQWGGAVALTSATRTFQSETSDDVELGLKSTFFEHRVQLNADLYQTNLDNFQDRSFNGLAFIVKNAGDVRARGAEVEGVIRPIEHVSVDFGGAYLDSIFTANHDAPGLPACTGAVGSCPLVQDLTGHTTTFAPKWTADVGLEYDTSPFSGGWTAQLRGSLNYTSKFFTTNDDNPQSIAGGQTLLGARATLVSPDSRWSVSLYGDNLTDEHYFTIKFPQTLDSLFGVRVPATGATLLRGFMGAPITFGGRIAAKF